MLTTDGEGEKLQKMMLKEVNSLILLEQKPRITLFYTCQAICLCESRHDAFACKQASSKAICHSSVPLALTRIKKKNPAPFGQKKQNSHASTIWCKHLRNVAMPLRSELRSPEHLLERKKRPCGATKTKTTGVYLVLRMVFPLEERGFSFCRITAL